MKAIATLGHENFSAVLQLRSPILTKPRLPQLQFVEVHFHDVNIYAKSVDVIMRLV